ncbi:MAG: prepilin-type N-terminal cleavage/methylation domain-containing protein [Pseudomonadota bacterium]
MKRQQGFTLVEIAIVLVIIGLILGGILKGQELIDSARVRSISNDISGIRTGWYAFQDRYNGLPGDFSRAEAQIGNSTSDGDGNGRVDTAIEVGGVWEHLADSGFISGDFGGEEQSIDDVLCDTESCPSNPFNGFYKISYGERIPGDASDANEFFTGDQIPVSIMLQLDNKLDDGVADDGEMRSHDDTDINCRSGSDWNLSGTGVDSCAAVIRGF